jgi:hypothetical protein
VGNRLRRLTIGHGRGIPGAIYGTVVAMSTITAAAASRSSEAVAVMVATTATVFYVAHVYAHAMGDSIHSSTPISWASLVDLARREVTIPLAAVLPVAALLLGAAGWVERAAAAWLAIAVGVASLTAQGVAYARIERLGPARAAAAVGANLVLGLTIVGFKAAVSH